MDEIKTIEVNVDDLNNGGVFSLVKNLLENKGDKLIDVASIEEFVHKENVEYFNDLGAKVFYVGSKKNKLLKQWYVYNNLKKLFATEKYKNVHIHGDTANKLFVSGLAAKRAKVPNIILHSHASSVDGNHRYIKMVIHYIFKPLLPALNARYVSCSDLAAKWMFGEKKYTMINNGVNLKKFRYNENIRIQQRDKLKISDEVLIGHIGRFAFQKNHEFILKIAKCLQDSHCNCKIILIGNGEDENRIRELAQKDDLENIIFYGTTKEPEKLFQAMDVFILPSQFEGLPIVGVEAQASGIPVIYSKNITKEAKLLENCCYLGIADSDVLEWKEKIMEYSNLCRYDTYELIKNKGFDILDTTEKICELYLG